MTIQRHVFFCGPFPSPKTGQTITTDFLYSHLRTITPKNRITKLDIVRGNGSRIIINYLIRFFRVIKAITIIFFLSKKNDTVYVSVDGNKGMIITSIIAFFGKLRKTSIILHHHTSQHVDQEWALMRFLAWCAGKSATHLTICPVMSADLSERYALVEKTDHISNVVHVLPKQGCISGNDGKKLSLGYMSKLSREKGVFEAIQLLSELVRKDVNACLHLAGSFSSKDEENLIRSKISDISDRVIFHGFVEGPQKSAFLHSIDIFLFPTLYRNETQGIVNLEALAHGVPVVAYARCCIASDLMDSGGLAVPPNKDFVQAASTFIMETASEPVLARAKASSFKRFLMLQQQGFDDLERFETLVLGKSRRVDHAAR